MKTRCPENQILKEHLEDLKSQMLRKGEEKKAKNLQRVINALQLFPLPILSGEMALDLLQWVGPWFARAIQDFLVQGKKRKPQIQPQETKQIKVQIYPGKALWSAILTIHLSQNFSLNSIKENFQQNVNSIYFGQEPDQSHIQELINMKLINSELELTVMGEILAEKFFKEVPSNLLKYRPTDLKDNFDPDSWLQLQPDFAPPPFFHQNQYQIILQMDTSQRLSDNFSSIYTKLSNQGIKVQRTKLFIGDYQWVIRTEVDLHFGILVQRKTADDLAQSIIDGRYFSQRSRIKNFPVTCIYLLEGTRPNSNSSISKSTLLKALVSTQFHYGFQIKVTNSPQESMNWLANMTDAVFSSISSVDLSKLVPLDEFLYQTNPNNSLTVRDVFSMQLRSLSNCGQASAQAIIERYPTLACLFEAVLEAFGRGVRALGRFFKQIKLESGNSLTKNLKKRLESLLIG